MLMRIQDVEALMMDQMKKRLLEDYIIVVGRIEVFRMAQGERGRPKRLQGGAHGKACQQDGPEKSMLG
jgi:hypothetical protein